MSFSFVPVIDRTDRAEITGTPFWYVEATQAETQKDHSVTIPSDANKIVIEWASDVGEFPSAVSFDPAGVNFDLSTSGQSGKGPIEGAFGQNGSYRVAGYYLDTPPTGSKTIRIATTSAAWTAVRIIAYRNARAGEPEAVIIEGTDVAGLLFGDDALLRDAYSVTSDLIVGDGLNDGDLTPFAGQTLDQDDVINSTFLAAGSDRTHVNNGTVSHGWTAATASTLLGAVVNVVHSLGQVASGNFQELSAWEVLNGTTFADEHGLSNASVSSGGISGGHDPLYSGGIESSSVQSTVISAAHVPEWQVPSWTFGIWPQVRSSPANGENRPFAGKDSGLPVPGGWQLEQYNDNGTIRPRSYIRNSSGLQGSAIWVTPETGAVEPMSTNTGLLLVQTYDAETNTAKLYKREAGEAESTLIAERTNPNFAGLENNTAPLSICCRVGTAGVEIDGLHGRSFFGSGAMTKAEIDALPVPMTVSPDPGAPGGIVMNDINLGSLAPSSQTDIDPTDHGTGFAGNASIEIFEISDAANRATFLNNPSDADNDPAAQIRITMPASAPEETTQEFAEFNLSEGAGGLSNTFRVNWTRQGTAGEDFTPFPWVTTSNPADNHSGVSNRPGFSPTDPRSASIVDPMSGIEIFRVGGDNGDPVRINGTTDSGLDFPRKLRQENLGSMRKTFNADSTLMMIDRYFSRSGDPSNPASSYLVDMDGSHGASAPWRILRASGSSGLGDGAGQWWVWDPLNPLRAYIFRDDGSIDEWWPIGGSGHSTGEVNNVFGPVSGFDRFIFTTRSRAQITPNGLYTCTGCRRTSDGTYGGIRRNMVTGALSSFIETPFPDNDENRRQAEGVSPSGQYMLFSKFGNWWKFHDVDTGDLVSDTGEGSAISHQDWATLDGKDFLVGCRGGGFFAWDIEAGTMIEKADYPASNPNHACTANILDLFETYGGTGSGSSSGLRYAIYARSNPNSGHPRAIMGVRLGANDHNVLRYICNHRSVRTDNSNECHPQVSPNGRFVVFNSNWQSPGVEGQDDVHPYVCLIPDAWWSPNNDGS